MATVTLLPTDNRRAFANFAAANKLFTFDPVTLEMVIPSVNQPALDGKLTAYHAGQAGIDTAFAAQQKTAQDDVKKTRFDDDPISQAVVAWATDEINTLRALHALPNLTPAQVDAAVKNKIDNP